MIGEPRKKKSPTKKTVHWHGCVRCETPYEDTCTTTKEDQLCTPCSGGRAWQYLIDNKKPRPCCIDRARMVTKEEMRRFDLAGSRIWFICPTCWRTQPFDPKRHPERIGPPYERPDHHPPAQR